MTSQDVSCYAAIAGRHALAIVIVLSVTIPFGAAAAWATLVRWVGRCENDGPVLKKRISIIALVAFTLAVCSSTIFFSIATRIEPNTPLSIADRAFIDSVRHTMSPVATRWFASVTHLGDPWLLTTIISIVCTVLVFSRHLGFSLYCVAVSSVNGLANQAFKGLFRRDRPFDESSVPVPDSFAFPSGHASGAVVCYGICAYVLLRFSSRHWQPVIIASAALLVFLVSASRVILGVHYLGDVTAGLASGATWLAGCIGIAEIVRQVKVIPKEQ
jgi:undecaprenyl-diphosphatase